MQKWKLMKVYAAILLFAILLLSIPACTPNLPATQINAPSPTPYLATPTPLALNQTAVYQGLEVTMLSSELTGEYPSSNGPSRVPPEDRLYAWVQLRLTNTTDQGYTLPDPLRFSLLYFNAEIKPSYGHRLDHPDYFDLESTLFPAQPVEAWLRYEVNSETRPGELALVFHPESNNVSFETLNAPLSWAQHPILLWVLQW
jgi:hypothetical protein